MGVESKRESTKCKRDMKKGRDMQRQRPDQKDEKILNDTENFSILGPDDLQ